jgi:hypothetical protein
LKALESIAVFLWANAFNQYAIPFLYKAIELDPTNPYYYVLLTLAETNDILSSLLRAFEFKYIDKVISFLEEHKES